jgi:hypothetical protein
MKKCKNKLKNQNIIKQILIQNHKKVKAIKKYKII